MVDLDRDLPEERENAKFVAPREPVEDFHLNGISTADSRDPNCTLHEWDSGPESATEFGVKQYRGGSRSEGVGRRVAAVGAALLPCACSSSDGEGRSFHQEDADAATFEQTFGPNETGSANAPSGVGDEEQRSDGGGTRPGHATTDANDGSFISEDEAPISVEQEPSEVECERQIDFEAVALEDAPPFDVVIVADHSASVAWSRDDLSRGLADLLTEVRGRNVRFFVLTPTQYGSDSAATSIAGINSLVTWKDPISGEPHADAVTSYSQICTNPEGFVIECPTPEQAPQTEYRLEGSFNFRMPAPVAQTTATMTEEELTAQQAAIQQAVFSLGEGSSYEQPLCTLGRYVAQDPALLPSHVVFVVISDEDDATHPRECLTGFTYERKRGRELAGGCGSDCDFQRYTVEATASRSGLRYRCVPRNDLGETFPELAVEGSATHNPIGSCGGVTVTDCTEQDLNFVTATCSPGALIESCQRTCAEGGTRTTCSLDLVDESGDACSSPFVLDGKSYASVADYCTQQRRIEGWVQCRRTGYTESAGGGSWTGSLVPRRLVEGTGPEDLVRHFNRKATAAFAEGAYFVETIVFAPQFSCSPASGQSYATNLVQVATTPDDVFPICESYAPALARVGDFAQALLETEYSVELSPRETLEAVVVTDSSGVKRELHSGDYTYDFDSALLLLNPAAIRSSDRELSIEIAIHCEFVVR